MNIFTSGPIYRFRLRGEPTGEIIHYLRLKVPDTFMIIIIWVPRANHIFCSYLQLDICESSLLLDVLTTSFPRLLLNLYISWVYLISDICWSIHLLYIDGSSLILNVCWSSTSKSLIFQILPLDNCGSWGVDFFLVKSIELQYLMKKDLGCVLLRK